MSEEDKRLSTETSPEIKARIIAAVRDSRLNIVNMEPVERDEALENVKDPLGWREFLASDGLMIIDEIPMIRESDEVQVGVAFVGPKFPENPSQGRIGAIGLKKRCILLGKFQ